MRALLRKASDYTYKKIIEVNTLEDLLKIYGSLIIETSEAELDLYNNVDVIEMGEEKVEIVITIYDDWIE